MTRLCDIEACNKAMPDYVGFVFAKSRRQVTPEQAAALKAHLSPEIKTVGVFVNEKMEQIAHLMEEGIIDIAQLHGSETEADIAALRSLIPYAPVIKAIRVETPEDVLAWQESKANFLLLDNGSGGTGQSFDWRMIPPDCKPFFLAGGLHRSNVLHAIETAHPYGVDLSSGIETVGLKDSEKIMEIVRIVRNGKR
jgi:phosphoribosylanthranilate isomerase